MNAIASTPRLYEVCFFKRPKGRSRELPPPMPRLIAYAKEVGADEYVIPFATHWRLATRDEALARVRKIRNTGGNTCGGQRHA
jgi:hypothetical protein